MSEDRRAAIEFDGIFEQVSSTGRWVLKTDEMPHIFVILPDKKLYVKKVQADVATATLLAEDVIQVAAVRGFRSTELDIDLGLTVAYMKSNGYVYTRNFVKSGSSRSWTAEKMIDSHAGNTFVQAFRLNDFRSAVFVEGSNLIYITPAPTLPDD